MSGRNVLWGSGLDRRRSQVNTADVLEILSPIRYVKAATAREVRQRIRSVLEWAIALDMRNNNPCNRVVRCSVRRTTS